MPFAVAAFATKPGKEDIVEKYYRERKIAFVEKLPGVIRYDVFRMEHRFDDPDATGPEHMKCTIIAIIELEDAAAARELRNGKLYRDFAMEYIHLFEDSPPIYAAHRVVETDAQSKEEFWGRHPEDATVLENN